MTDPAILKRQARNKSCVMRQFKNDGLFFSHSLFQYFISQENRTFYHKIGHFDTKVDTQRLGKSEK